MSPQPPRPGPWRSQGRSYWNLDRGWSCVERTHGGVGSFVQVSGSPQQPSWEEARKAISNSLSSCPPFLLVLPRGQPGGSSVGCTSRMQSRQRVGPERQGRSLPPLGALNRGHGRCRHTAHSSTKGLTGSRSWGKLIREKVLSFSESIEPITEHSNIRENEDEEGEDKGGEDDG